MSSRPATAGSPTSEGPTPPRIRRAKITPIPYSQMIPMVIVIMNESICSTMLMPFIGPFVAYLRGVPVNKAGYFSGMIVGVFMLGQVVSAKAWGRISDTYGRRFPIISGLFTSGVMMLGFGLSTNIWTLAVFRFFHGLFNGNVLVAKTMMADITDRTNQASGFSLISICNSFGMLIGSALGGLLYDPAHSSALSWAQIDEKGFLGTHPAFLISFVVFMYTNIGMLVCTFLVRESNPKAQPLPGFVRFIYPCMWYKSDPFVPPPIQYEEEEDDGDVEVGAGSREGGGEAVKVFREGREFSTMDESRSSEERPREGGTLSSDVARGCRRKIAIFSPVDREDPRKFDEVLIIEDLVVPVESAAMRQARAAAAAKDRDHENPSQTSLSRQNSTTTAGKVLDHGEKEGEDTAEGVLRRREDVNGAVRAPSHSAGALSTREGNLSISSREGVVVVTTADVQQADGEPVAAAQLQVTKFGYRQAFARPYTRFMLTQYMVLCAADMAGRDCFPLYAVATTDAGGLGMTIGQVSYILLANSLPCFVANFLFRIVERRYMNKMGLFRVGMFLGGTMVFLLPFNTYFAGTLFVYLPVFLCTAMRQMFVSWCYSLNTMLTARSAPPGHVGSIMGINQSCNALVRSFVPSVAAPLFAWSISGSHQFPFNHFLIFLLSSMGYYYVWWRSYGIRTDAEGNLEIVES